MLSFVANSFAAKVLLIVNKIILFRFLFFNSGRYNNKKTGDYQEQRRMGLRMFGPKLFLTPHICHICYVFSFPFPFPGILGNDSLWFPFPNWGNGFFHSLPVPELWEWIFFIPFQFPNFRNQFFHSLPISEFWEWFFFRSRTSGMELSIPVPIPVPVPELPNAIPAHTCFRLIYAKLTLLFLL